MLYYRVDNCLGEGVDEKLVIVEKKVAYGRNQVIGEGSWAENMTRFLCVEEQCGDNSYGVSERVKASKIILWDGTEWTRGAGGKRNDENGKRS